MLSAKLSTLVSYSTHCVSRCVTRYAKRVFPALALKVLAKGAGRLFALLLVIGSLASIGSLNAQDGDSAQDSEPSAASDAELSQQVESVKRSALELNRDLLILEEELLFPSNTRLNVFLSMDVGYYFRLDSVKLSVDGKVVASHLYTDRQNYALNRGGVQRLYVGNIKQGDHEITAVFTGIGPNKREYKRGATTIVNKDRSARALELQIRDAEDKQQPTFTFTEWETE